MVDVVTTAHLECVDVAEDGRFQKLKLIVLNTSMEDVVAVHRMALVLEE